MRKLLLPILQANCENKLVRIVLYLVTACCCRKFCFYVKQGKKLVVYKHTFVFHACIYWYQRTFKKESKSLLSHYSIIKYYVSLLLRFWRSLFFFWFSSWPWASPKLPQVVLFLYWESASKLGQMLFLIVWFCVYFVFLDSGRLVKFGEWSGSLVRGNLELRSIKTSYHQCICTVVDWVGDTCYLWCPIVP